MSSKPPCPPAKEVEKAQQEERVGPQHGTVVVVDPVVPAKPGTEQNGHPRHLPGEHSASPLDTATIRPMPAESVRRIVAGQAIYDLASCTKELIDNALDAGSRNINIRLFNKGLDIVEVSDDGRGVPRDSRASLALPHATSKISSFDDIYDSQKMEHTLGFRGEALYSLANLSTQLVVATRCETDALAQKMEFARDGTLQRDKVVEIPRKVGTTVAVVGLLAAVPVRRRDLEHRIHQQRARLVQTVMGYAVFSTGVRLHLMDIVVSQQNQQHAKEKTILATAANSQALRETVSSVLGAKFLAGLVDVEIDLKETLTDGDAENIVVSDSSRWKITGLMASACIAPKKSNTKNSQNQFFAINRRPVDLPKVSRLLKECFRSFGQDRAPACVLEFHLPGNAYDINLSPDKRQVLLTRETEVLQAIQKAVTDLWSRQTDGQFQPSDSLSNLTQSHHNSMAQRGQDDMEQDDKDDNDFLGDSSNGSRLFDRRYAFVHDPTTSVVREQNDQQKRLQYERSSPDRLHRKRRSFQAEPPVDAQVVAGTIQNDATSQQVMIACDDDDNSENGAPRQRITKRLQMQANTCDGDEDQTRNNSTTCIELNNGTTVTPSPGTPPRQLGFLFSGLAPAAIRNNRSNNYPSDTEHDKIPTMTSSTTAGGASRSGMSPQEKKNWRRLQTKFNYSNSDSHAVDDKGFTSSDSMETVSRSTGLAQFRATSSAADESTKAAATRTVTNSHGFERFGFRAVKAKATGESAQDCAVRPAPQKSITATKEDLLTVGDAPPRKEPCRTVSGEVTRRKGHVIQADHGTTASTTWFSFGETGDVIVASMRDRLGQCDRKQKHRELASLNGDSISSRDVCVQDDDDVAQYQNEAATTVCLTKDDFTNMKVLGQFNLGFILACSQNGNLFVLDQHASDERFNFEKLCNETVIHEQRLIAPMPLELSTAEESCILDHMDIFQKNGFRFRYDEAKPPRHRLSLTALPHSGARDGRKAVQYGKEDVLALCAILGVGDDDDDEDVAAVNGGTGTDGSGMYRNNAVRRYATGNRSMSSTTQADKIIARLPKSIAMFASRACRGSVMIGTALSERDMSRIVERLGEVEHPWNCPHGRPTMRHVADLRPVLNEDDRRTAERVSGPTATVMSQELDSDDGD